MRKLAQIPIMFGLVVLVWGVWRQNYEEMAYGLADIVVVLVWDFAHDRHLTGAKILHEWRPSPHKLRIAAYVLAAFALATAAGVWIGFIPGGLVVVMLAFILAAPILAALPLFAYQRCVTKAKAAASWPQVIGHIENSFMTEAGRWPAPIVSYTYEVEGRRHRGARVRFGGTGGMNPMDAEQVLASYPAGADVPIFYNPERPRQSVLLPDGARVNKGLLWCAGMLAAAPLLGAVLLGLFIVLGFVDAALTAIVGHRVLP